jgi:hypothetical protein
MHFIRGLGDGKIYVINYGKLFELDDRFIQDAHKSLFPKEIEISYEDFINCWYGLKDSKLFNLEEIAIPYKFFINGAIDVLRAGLTVLIPTDEDLHLIDTAFCILKKLESMYNSEDKFSEVSSSYPERKPEVVISYDDGYGNSHGTRYGDGLSDGYGYGNGNGHGYGYAYGHSYGMGYGDGYGYGDGDEDGDGDGDGWYGYGYV